MTNRWTSVLFLLALGLGAALAAELRYGLLPPLGFGEAGLTEPDVVPTLPSLTFSPPPLQTLEVTVRRPLFTVTRRPPERKVQIEPEVAAAPVAAPPVSALQVVLSAIIINAGERLALLSDPSSGLTTVLREGDGMLGWQLVQIAEQSVVFQREGQRLEIPLRQFAPAGRPVSPSAPRVVVKKPQSRATDSRQDRSERTESPEPSG